MTACGPGSSKPIRHHADEVRSSQTAPSSAAGWVATTLCKTVTRLAIERASCQAFGRWRATQTDGLCVALEHPSCVRGCDPTVPTPNVDDESLPAVIVISCALAGRRSGWRERAHHALACGGYHSRLSANALVSNRAFAFEYLDCGCSWHKYVRCLSLRRGRPQWYPDSTSAPRRDYIGDQGRSPEKCHAAGPP